MTAGPDPVAKAGGDDRFRRVVLTVALLNFGYFFVEALVAWRIGSVSLFADAVDFLEDTAVNLLVLWALSGGARLRAGTALLLAALITVPGFAALWTAYQKVLVPVPPDASLLSFTGAGALAVNMTCAVLLARLGTGGGSLIRAAFLSARNDVAANIAIIVAGVLTALLGSIWPDIIVGLLIALLMFHAAYEVYQKAIGEWNEAAPGRDEATP